jgi:Secretion system C-terminal sorting domain/Reeler domain
MKKNTKITISIFAIAIGSVLISEYSSSAEGNPNGAPGAYAGDPASGNKTCAASGCHTGPAVTSVTGWITTTIPVAGYTPDSTYTITATITRSGHSRFGFEVSAQNTSGTVLGVLKNTSTATKLINANKYITQTASSGTSGSRVYTFDWTAPAAGKGDVTFYGAFNAAGGFTNQLGDTIFTSTTLVSENTTTGIADLKNNFNHISVYPNPVTDNFFVNNSMNETGCTTIHISDINGRLVKKIQNVRNRQSVDIADFAKGVYILRIETGNGDVVKKIVKE